MTTQNFVMSFQTLDSNAVKPWVKELLYATLSHSLIGNTNLKTLEDFEELIKNFQEEKESYMARKQELQTIMASEQSAQEYAEKERADVLTQQHTYRKEKVQYLQDFRTKVDIIKSLLTTDESSKINVFLKGLIEDLEEIYKQQDDIEILDGQIADTETKEASVSFNESIALIDMSIDICDKNINNVKNVIEVLKEIDERIEGTNNAVSADATETNE